MEHVEFRKIKIDRKFKKNGYTFYVYLKRDSLNCTVRKSCTDKHIDASIESDLKTVRLFEEVEIESLDGYTTKAIRTLSIPKDKGYILREAYLNNPNITL